MADVKELATVIKAIICIEREIMAFPKEITFGNEEFMAGAKELEVLYLVKAQRRKV